jgi:hypothetical protein
MNTINIDTDTIQQRLVSQTDRITKSNIKSGKNMSGRKERATKQYFKDDSARARRKQGKTRFDTHRREEQPDERDLQLEDIHFANFLGLPRSEDGIPYNNVHIDEPVNIIECDIYLKSESSKNVAEEAAAPQDVEEDDYDSIIGSEDEAGYVRQISREPNTKWDMRWYYEPETRTLTGESAFKRGRDDEEEQEAKYARIEEVNFDKMVEYMREQVRIAELIAANELYPCELNR